MWRGKFGVVGGMGLCWFLILFVCSTTSQGATMHAIIIADTNAWDIGQSVERDFDHVRLFFKAIAQTASLRYNPIEITGDRVSSKNIQDQIQNMNVNSDDVIVLYYSGHGAGNENGDLPVPILTFINGEEMSYLTVLQMVYTHRPRLLVALADCCNSYSDSQEEDQLSHRKKSIIKPQRAEKLFVYQQGMVIAWAAKPGQYARGNREIGGYFTATFLLSLFEELQSSDPSWEQLLQNCTPIRLRQSDGQIWRQDPQYVVELEPVE